MSRNEAIVRIGKKKFIVENDTTNTGVMSYEEAKMYAKGKRIATNENNESHKVVV